VPAPLTLCAGVEDARKIEAASLHNEMHKVGIVICDQISALCVHQHPQRVATRSRGGCDGQSDVCVVFIIPGVVFDLHGLERSGGATRSGTVDRILLLTISPVLDRPYGSGVCRFCVCMCVQRGGEEGERERRKGHCVLCTCVARVHVAEGAPTAGTPSSPCLTTPPTAPQPSRP